MKRIVVAAVLGALGLVAGSCATQMQCPANEPAQCQQTGGTEEAIVAGAAGATLWATAGGCKINGCHPPYVCNEETELCESPFCGEGRPCPAPYSCDERRHRCF